MTIRDRLHSELYYYFFLLLAFLIPAYQRAVPVVIILIVLNWISEGNFKTKLNRIKTRESSGILLFGLLFLVYMVSLIYSSNIRQGMFELEVALSLLVFPVIFATIEPKIFSLQKSRHIFVAFCTGCLVASILMLGSATFRYLISPDLKEFIYYKFASGRHSSYISMYFSLNIAIIAFYLIQRWESYTLITRFMLYILLTYFTFQILLLSSKAGIISLMVVFLIFSIYAYQRKAHFVPGLLISILAVIFILLAFKVFLPTASRFNEALTSIQNFEEIEPQNTESTAERILIWDCAVEAAIQRPLAGYGIGDVKEELDRMYQKNKVEHASRMKLNAHNQYLQTLLATGLAGMITLVLLLAWPFFRSLSRKNLLYAVFLLLIGMNFLFESMLCRQAGVVFYAFFNGFFLFSTDQQISKSRVAI